MLMPEKANTHVCPAVGCAVTVQNHLLMCRRHWSALPKPLRDAIYETCASGQRSGLHPTREYAENVRSAKEYLRQGDDGALIVDGIAMPAITVWQPWATLIAIGAKPFEFRGHPAPRIHQGKRIAIQAGARQPKEEEMRDLLLRVQSSFWRDTGLIRRDAIKLLSAVLVGNAKLPRSVIVCTAQLGVPLRNAEMEQALGLPVVNDSDRHEHSQYGWPLTDVRPMEPLIPCKGAQGFFTVTVPRSHG